jgi:hypothetical protein
MSELGPFYPTKSGTKLQANPYPWNDMANVIWLESPAFVGFSYSNSSADAIVGELIVDHAWCGCRQQTAGTQGGVRRCCHCWDGSRNGFSYSNSSADAIVGELVVGLGLWGFSGSSSTEGVRCCCYLLD